MHKFVNACAIWLWLCIFTVYVLLTSDIEEGTPTEPYCTNGCTDPRHHRQVVALTLMVFLWSSILESSDHQLPRHGSQLSILYPLWVVNIHNSNGVMNESAESYTDNVVTVKHVMYYHVARKHWIKLYLVTSNRMYNYISYSINFSDYIP